MFSACCVGVVCKIPLSCGSLYTRQTGCYVNDRMREHASFLRGTPVGHLAVHCNRCGCKPVSNKLSIVRRLKDRVAREVLEAFLIHRSGEMCECSVSGQ